MLPVALIEDDDVHAELFSMRLSQIDGLKFDLHHFRTGAEAIRTFDRFHPQVLFVDYLLEAETGIEIIEQIRSRGHRLPIVALTAHGDEYVAAKITRAGADEYLAKADLTANTLVELLDRMLAIGHKRSQLDQASRAHAENLATLTDREVEVLDAILAGKTNKQIAAEFCRSIKTIKVHRSRIMDKMQANTPAELAKFVLEARQSLPT